MAELFTGVWALVVLAYVSNRRHMKRARHIFDLPAVDDDGGQ